LDDEAEEWVVVFDIVVEEGFFVGDWTPAAGGFVA